MGKKDIALARYFEDEDRYADLINGYVFSGEQVVSGSDILEKNILVTGVLGTVRKWFAVQKYRDARGCRRIRRTDAENPEKESKGQGPVERGVSRRFSERRPVKRNFYHRSVLRCRTVGWRRGFVFAYQF